jgi:hypothetical protein
LVVLEGVALRSPSVQKFMVRTQAAALRRVLEQVTLDQHARVAVVGGGLFPRTVLALWQVQPDARLTVIDASAHNIALAKAYLGTLPESRLPTFECAFYDPERNAHFDVVIIPMGYMGDRSDLYEPQQGPILLIHDWLWRRRGDGGVPVSALLAKRLNFVRPAGAQRRFAL